MSKQLSVSATASVLAMVLLAMVTSLGGTGGNAFAQAPMIAPLSSVQN
jgi:hypothetical protein